MIGPAILRRALVALALSLFAFAGCSVEYDPRHPFSEGWRRAEVEAIDGPLDAVDLRGTDCRTIAPSADAAYAAVWFVERRRLQRWIVLLPIDARVAVGDDVFFNVRTCDQALEPIRP